MSLVIFLFSRHIRKNILAQCKKTFETKEKVDLFMSEWNIMVMADTVENFVQLFDRLNKDFVDFPKLLTYVNST